MSKDILLNIKNEAVLAYIDSKVEEFNQKNEEGNQKMSRTKYINYILEKVMIQDLEMYDDSVQNIETKVTQTKIMVQEIQKIMQEQNKSIRNLIEEIEL
ncbi:hypothetical protein [Catellicoccus marimammalium]|uniref:Uncharacterized protein n=1 Tax=Catellicoccus marimammalium M35/04/3 TaxID=1234409 RepID=K8ZNM8_9ENTE|nr:hypothetical protein [Catellicoccus marimammalium]EKU27201.1 hypothetical protein C683_0858 [Catellicoccus marimammalium M35/04/3]